ncbi:MAG: reprolysin-like metallopeptidase [Phycisphaerae bacterium]
MPDKFEAFGLDHAALGDVLSLAPLELSEEAKAFQPEIQLPMPDGSYARFRFVESPIMEPGLAAKYPGIKTYLGKGVDDPLATVRFDITPAGFHAQILSPSGRVLIDPYFKGDNIQHVSFNARDNANVPGPWQCLVKGERQANAAPVLDETTDALRIGETLRTYRLANAATGEYTAFHGGSVASGQAAIVTAINRVNQVYEADVAVRMVLVANNDQLVYTNSGSDPYTNFSGFTMLGENQANVDSVIGSGNYDIGHVFSTGGGGVAGLGVVCLNNQKARGVTGLSSPTGDSFYIDFVAHEMGHQFGGNHTFNGSLGNCSGGNRSGAHAYEPGSGSTVMAYAGICSQDNLQFFSDPFFHHESIREIRNFVTGFGGGCAAQSGTANTDPTVSAGANFTIPQSTPFELTALNGFDPEGDPITYSWEERDLGPQASVLAPDDGQIPLFRFWPPVTIPSRIFPRLSDLLNNTTVKGEQLPTTSRTMDFRVTVRDRATASGGVGGTGFGDMTVTVSAGAGPFLVTSPNNGTEAWASTGDVIWDVANTDLPPVNAANVDITLSTDGGLTYPITLLAGTPNDGFATVVVPPGNQTSSARVRVQGSNNIFFDISDQNFTLGPQGPLAIILPNGSPLSIPVGTATNFDVEITDLEETLVPGTAILHYRYGGGAFLTAPLTAMGGILYQATLPAAGCSDTPEFYVSAQGNLGGTVTEPANAPATTFSAVVGQQVPFMTETFDAGEGTFTYQDGLFRGTADPDAFVDGVFDVAGGNPGGGLHLTLGPLSTEMSGGWVSSFNVANGPADVQVDLSYRLLMSGLYEAGEIAQALMSVDGALIGEGANDYILQFEGDGNVPATDMDSGWRTFSVVVSGLSTGAHQLAVGGYNNASTFSNEITDVFFDNVTLSQFECTPLTQIVSVSSVQDHGGTPLGLDLLANPVEPRLNGVELIEVGLDNPVASVSASVSCVNQTYAGTLTATPAGNNVSLAFAPALADVDCCTVSLSGDVIDSFIVQPLRGDVDLSGAVTTGDASQVRFFFNQTAAAAGAQWDFDASGTVTTGDFSQIRFFFNNTAPTCP